MPTGTSKQQLTKEKRSQTNPTSHMMGVRQSNDYAPSRTLENNALNFHRVHLTRPHQNSNMSNNMSNNLSKESSLSNMNAAEKMVKANS